MACRGLYLARHSALAQSYRCRFLPCAVSWHFQRDLYTGAYALCPAGLAFGQFALCRQAFAHSDLCLLA